MRGKLKRQPQIAQCSWRLGYKIRPRLSFGYLAWVIIFIMSHHLESILELARKYQIPLWQYQQLQMLNPYFLASMGYQPLERGVVECSICLKKVGIEEGAREQPARLLQQLKTHQQNCIYHNEQPLLVKKEDLYLAIDQISNDLNQGSANNRYPLLNPEAFWNYSAPNHFLLKKVMNLYQINKDKFSIPFFLRLFGWVFNKRHQTTCIQCYFCGKNVPLQNYKSSEHALQSFDIEPDERLFNPVEQHRYFCLWTNQQQNWTVYLQDLQEKYAEYVSFELRVQPLSVKKMKFHIDKYLETFREKIENSVLKLKQVSDQFGRLSGELEQEREAELSGELIEGGRKRIRSIQQQIQGSANNLTHNLIHSSKRFKSN